MKKLLILLCLLLMIPSARAESDLVGVWSFAGGGEVMGMGFRLNGDGTGEWLDTQDEHTPAKHLRATGSGFTWKEENGNFITARNIKNAVIIILNNFGYFGNIVVKVILVDGNT